MKTTGTIVASIGRRTIVSSISWLCSASADVMMGHVYGVLLVALLVVRRGCGYRQVLSLCRGCHYRRNHRCRV